jgi:hypothetical protein
VLNKAHFFFEFFLAIKLVRGGFLIAAVLSARYFELAFNQLVLQHLFFFDNFNSELLFAIGCPVLVRLEGYSVLFGLFGWFAKIKVTLIAFQTAKHHNQTRVVFKNHLPKLANVVFGRGHRGNEQSLVETTINV